MTIHITIEEIELIFARLIQRVKNDEIKFVDIEADYYWIVTTDEWGDFTSSSPQVAVGSLVDDWDSLQKILRTEQIVTYLDLERYASIMRAMSEAIAPSTKQSVTDPD